MNLIKLDENKLTDGKKVVAVCSLCVRTEIPKDEDYENRLLNHIEYHKVHTVKSVGANGQIFERNLNITKGTPTFTEIEIE